MVSPDLASARVTLRALSNCSSERQPAKTQVPRRELTPCMRNPLGRLESASLAESSPHSERRAIEVLASGGTFRDAFEALPAFLQQLSVEAFQSSLWNRTLVRMCVSAGLTVEKRTATSADGICESLLFPESRLLPREWNTVHIPMLCPAARLAAPWGDAAEHELNLDQMTLRDLRIPGLRRPAFGEALRPMVATASDVRVGPAEKDTFDPKRLARTLEFTLPRGTYATVLLRALGE
jgi:tRNA pseudouridine13 synthase